MIKSFTTYTTSELYIIQHHTKLLFSISEMMLIAGYKAWQ